jgi:hypothetical protein
MSRINVLVAATPPDLEAAGIAAAVAAYADMALIEARVLALSEVACHLNSLPRTAPCALILVGRNNATQELANHWLGARRELVVLRVDVIEHLVHIAHISTRDKSLELDSLLSALRDLVDNAGVAATARTARFMLYCASGDTSDSGESSASLASEAQAIAPAGAVFQAARQWLHAVMRNGVAAQHSEHGDFPGWTLTPATVAKELDARASDRVPEVCEEIAQANSALAQALKADAAADPLAQVCHRCSLTALEFRVLLLAMAPELDIRYQRCVGLMLDDLSRRVGTLGLYASLVGESAQVRCALAQAGSLTRWRMLEHRAGALPCADEPLRLDPHLLAWLLGEAGSLDLDPCVKRLTRLAAWPGAGMFERPQDLTQAAGLVRMLQGAPEGVDGPRFILFNGDTPSDWCALLELGAERNQVLPIRVDAALLAGVHGADVEESGVRLGRLARLTGRPLMLDTTGADTASQDDESLRLLLATIAATGTRCGVICAEPARMVRLLGAIPFILVNGVEANATVRLAHVNAVARQLDIAPDAAVLDAVARQYPLQAGGFEQAMRLARARTLPADDQAQRIDRFISACQHVAAEGVSRLADCIEPGFELDDVILPPDRSLQLKEIVDSVRLASAVLDDWKFGLQLPYGRGVTVLFHGPSGTGKTMAAISLAKRLHTRVLRIDLSRVVSKYIGDTEKNIDRIFLDAQRSGAAILIDEAEALLGKRSEVKDAHDRYANIEVAYLLQRMETYEGLAILTTNLRQNLDPAFLRRLRFVIDFPRPDAEAREKIWRRCLPEGSHALDEAMIRHLARKVDMTGGHIRQITLRAAFLAAAAGSLIELSHIAHATRGELTKLGMAAIDLDVPSARRAA